LSQVNTHRPDAVTTQEHLVDIIELGDRAWDIGAEEEKTAMESEQMLYTTLLLALKEDFGIILEETPTFTLMDDETVEEMMQEALCGVLKWSATHRIYTPCQMKLLLLVVLQGMISQIMVVSSQNSSITTKLLFDHIQYYCYQLNGFFTLQNGIQRGRVQYC
jgi:hypothetical protein